MPDFETHMQVAEHVLSEVENYWREFARCRGIWSELRRAVKQYDKRRKRLSKGHSESRLEEPRYDQDYAWEIITPYTQEWVQLDSTRTAWAFHPRRIDPPFAFIRFEGPVRPYAPFDQVWSIGRIETTHPAHEILTLYSEVLQIGDEEQMLWRADELHHRAEDLNAAWNERLPEKASENLTVTQRLTYSDVRAEPDPDLAKSDDI